MLRFVRGAALYEYSFRLVLQIYHPYLLWDRFRFDFIFFLSDVPPGVCVCVCMFGHNRNWNVDAEVCAFSSPVFITVVSRLRCGLYSKSKSPRQTFLSNRFSSLCFFHICYFFLILCKTKRSTGIHETHLPQFSYSFCSSSSGVIRREWPKYFCWCVAGNKKNI